MTAPSAGVIGGGIYGAAAAVELAELGLDVTLYETRGQILSGATANNFFRLHRGYHYPRSPETARQAVRGYTAFLGTFAEALTPGVPHYYAIAAGGSQTSPEQFEEHCASLGLRARPVPLPLLTPRVAACWETDEYYYDPDLLRACAADRLAQYRIPVRVSCEPPQLIARVHDLVVVTGYADLNEILAALGCQPRELQYELCEVAVIDAPELGELSLVVLDGPFCSIAPYQGRHILYDVEHSVHDRVTATSGPVLLQDGKTRFGHMLASADRFVKMPSVVRYSGSLWARRVVLPGVDATDARPYRAWWASDRVLSVLSGKVSACVLAAREIGCMAAVKLGLPGPEEMAS